VRKSNLATRSLLGFNGKLLTHSGKDDNVWTGPISKGDQGGEIPAAHTGILLLGGEELLNLVTNLSIWDLDIILGLTIIGHQGEETIVGNIELQDLVRDW